MKLSSLQITLNVSWKDLGITLYWKLNFNTHVHQKIKKATKLIVIIGRLSVNLPRNASLTICKSFTRTHLYYGNILFNKPNNENFQNKI